MAGTMRRSFAVTFTSGSDPAVLDCLRRLDALTAELRALAREEKCTYIDTITEDLEQIQTVTYAAVYGYFREHGFGGNRSKVSAHVMQALFGMRKPDGERAVRFYCRSYHHVAGVCACPEVSRLSATPPRQIRYRMLSVVAVARAWLMDRADLLALTDEQLAALDTHFTIRQHVTDFVTWLRDHPTAP